MQPAELCKHILGISSTIVQASILDNHGSVLSRQYRNPDDAQYETSEDALKKYGTWVKLTFSMAQATDHIFGTTEYLTIAHERFKHAAVPLPSESGFVAMVLDRTADVERIASLIQSTTTNTQAARSSNQTEHYTRIPRKVGSQ